MRVGYNLQSSWLAEVARKNIIEFTEDKRRLLHFKWVSVAKEGAKGKSMRIFFFFGMSYFDKLTYQLTWIVAMEPTTA